MKRSWQRVLLLQLFILSFGGPFSLQAADWPMYAHDPQRSGWAPEEKALGKNNVRGLELKWKTKVENEPKLLNALTAPVVATGVDTEHGKLSLVYVAGSSNNFYALNAATGAVVWHRVFDSAVLPATGKLQGTVYCPLSVNATPLIERATGTVYAIAMDGRLFGMDLATGVDKFQPMPFVAPFSKNWSLNLVDGIIYTSLAQGCGDAPSGFYSVDIRNPRRPLVRRLLTSISDSAGIWGRGGPVVGKNHKIYGLTADGVFNPSTGEFGVSMIAASLPELGLVDYFTPPNWEWLNKRDLDMSASPVWFTYGKYDLVVGGGKEGVLYMLDANSLGGRDHHTALFTTPRLGNDEASSGKGRGIWGAPAYWQDESGQAWIYVPVWGPDSKDAPKFPQANGPHPHGSVMAFKVVLDNVSKKPTLAAAWVSGDFNLPDPPIVVNGVLFVMSTGENADQSANRLQSEGHAVLYALDAKTGETLYDSGELINGWVHFSGLAVSDGLVYAVDHDSWVYCFGPKEALSPAAQVDHVTSPPTATSTVDFKRDIEPIFRERCLMCHGPSRQMGGLRLDNRASALKGGDSGPAIRPGNSAESKLIQLVSGEEKDLVMPLGLERLTVEQVDKLRAWIDQGAEWPEGADHSQSARTQKFKRSKKN